MHSDLAYAFLWWKIIYFHKNFQISVDFLSTITVYLNRRFERFRLDDKSPRGSPAEVVKAVSFYGVQ